MNKVDARYWSPFWKNRTITSFGNLFPENYDGLMLDFWKRHVTADVRELLDLACGNGAVTWIANEIAAGTGATTRITGVDIADIDPFRVLGRTPADYPRVRFLGGTPIEHLPMPDASADLVVSQYGIEYSDLDTSMREVGRVLGRSGRLALILHDRESVIVKGATVNLDDFRKVHRDLRLHELCAALDELLRSDRNLKRLAASKAFSEFEGRVMQARYHAGMVARTHSATSPLVAYLASLDRALGMRRPDQAGQRGQLIRQAAHQLQAHIERIEDLWTAALTPERRQHLTQLAGQLGFTVTELDVLRYKDGDNFGTLFAASRL